MKLKKLKFAYFQSYNREIEINFDDLNGNLFLFSGPTGSGKTTIFDAICYALFGSMSNEEKNNDEIKSNYASDFDLCYVELTFTINQIDYTIKRIPSQVGPGKQNRPIKIVANAFLDKFNLSKIEEINQKIKELLHMNLEQFRQIVLLPQGKFQKLLMSNSDEKEKIFRSLFNTSSFLKLQMELKNKINQISSEIKTIIALINTITPKDFQTSNYDQLLSNLNEKKTSLLVQLELNKKEQEQLQQQIELYNQVRTTSQTLTEKQEQLQQLSLQNIDELQNLVHQFESYRPLFPFELQFKNKNEEYQLLIKEKDEVETQLFYQKRLLSDTSNILNELKKQEDEYQKNKHQILRLQEQLSRYENYDLLKKEHDILFLELNQIQLLEENGLNQEINVILAQLNDIQIAKNDTLAFENQKKVYNLKKEKLIPIHVIEEYEKKHHLYQELSLQFNHFSQNLRIQFEKLNQLKNNYYNSIAGSLASTLKENTPCPVCGSLHHPTHAKEFDFVKKEDVEIQEKIYQDAYNEYTKVEIDIKNITDFLEKYTLNEIMNSKIIHKELAKKIQAIDLEIVNKQETINKEDILNKELNQKKDKLKSIQDYNKLQLEKQFNYKLEITAISSKLEEFSFSRDKDSIINEIKEYQAKNDEYDDIKFRNQEVLSKTTANIEIISNNLEKLNKKIENSLTEINSIHSHIDSEIKTKKLVRPQINEEDYFKYSNQIISYQATYDTLSKEVIQIQKKIESYPTIDISLTQLKELYIQKNEDYTYLQSEYLKYNDLINKISKSIDSYYKFNDEFKVYSELLDVANGDVNKNNNISFERFVLGYYLDQIINFANNRLEKMSENRYYFERKTDYKGRGKKGLELSVFDCYNGYSRSVTTLSGGESFQASLALSLGLSDYLSQKSTSNHINFLFIDEGFGSLDSESLDIAISTLIEICDGGKSIGIISHVEELKNRIPLQILIKKSKQGSTISIQK